MGRGISVAKAFATENLYISHDVDVTKPSQIRGMVNQRCNYKCGYCNCWNMDEYKDEISIDEWKSALDSLKDYLGRFTIQFAGGEPFLKKGFIDLLEHCNQQDITWGVITNGSAFTDKNIQRIVAARPFNIDVSVDSHQHAVNDFARGYEGGLSKIEYGVKLLRQYRESSHQDFSIRFKTVVSKINFLDLPEMVVWAEKIGVDMIDFSPVRPRWNWTEKEKNAIEISTDLDYKALDRVVSRLIKMKQSGAIIETPEEKLLSMSILFKGKTVFSGVAPCRVGLRDYHILADGDVEVCWTHPPIGNVIKQSAQEIWTGERAKEIRKNTVACSLFGTQKCASSCLDHRTPLQEIKRAMLILHHKKSQAV